MAVVAEPAAKRATCLRTDPRSKVAVMLQQMLFFLWMACAVVLYPFLAFLSVLTGASDRSTRLLAQPVALATYLPVLCVHKWEVFRCGQRMNLLLQHSGLTVAVRRLICHDWSKFSPTELGPYALKWVNQNLGNNALGKFFVGLKIAEPVLVDGDPVVSLFGGRLIAGYGWNAPEWKAAFEHHCSCMDHHLEYYRLNPGAAAEDDAAVEMVSDWMGACWAYDGKWPKKFSVNNFRNWAWPNERMKALFFGVAWAAGLGASFDGEYSWEEAAEQLGESLSEHLKHLGDSKAWENLRD